MGTGKKNTGKKNRKKPTKLHRKKKRQEKKKTQPFLYTYKKGCFLYLNSKNYSKQISGLTLYHTIPTLNDPEKKAFENIVGKRENAGNQHFLLFPQCFLPFPKQISIFQSHLLCCLQMLSIWTCLKFCHLVKS